jgi:hypothetical protein
MTEWPIRREWGNEVIADGGKLTVESGGEMDFEAGSALKVGGVQLTPSAAEMNVLDGVTAGTVTASKALVVGANKNLDTLAIADSGLKLGAGAGTAVTKTAAQINALVAGLAGGYVIARGQHTTVAASDTVVTGLATVVAVVAILDSDPTTDPLFVTASIGDPAGAPAAGSVYIKSWKPTANDNVTPVAATTFTKKVNWIAIGT